MLQSLLAYLLAACGEDADAVIQASELIERFSIPAESLEEHLSLLNLVNFGGGCYAVYAELQGDEVHVDKELFGDTFRRAPRLTPLEARAIRLALEFVGPMISAGSRSPLDRVREKLEEAFGQFDLAQTPTPQAGAEEDMVGTLTRAIDRKRLVELEYLKPESTEVETRTIEPYGIERRLPHWTSIHGTSTAMRLEATVSTARGRRRSSPPSCSPGRLRPSELSKATSARIWYRPRSAAGRSRRAPCRLSTAPPSRSGRRERGLARRRGALVPGRGRRARPAGAPRARRRQGARPRAPLPRGAREGRHVVRR